MIALVAVRVRERPLWSSITERRSDERFLLEMYPRADGMGSVEALSALQVLPVIIPIISSTQKETGVNHVRLF